MERINIKTLYSTKMDTKQKSEDVPTCMFFDSEAYNKQYYSDAHDYCDTIKLYEMYASGLLKGETFIDVGTGPSLFTVVPAGKHFQSIVLSDYNPAHLDYLKKWQNKEGDVHFWDLYFKKVAEIHGERDNWKTYEKELREKIKEMKFCDVRQKNPFQPQPLEQFDVVSCSQMLECTSANLSEYKQNVKNLSNLIKPGGKVVVVGELEATYFTVGKNTYPLITLEGEFVKEAFTKAGLMLDQWEYFDIASESDAEDYQSSFILVASKPVSDNIVLQDTHF